MKILIDNSARDNKPFNPRASALCHAPTMVIASAAEKEIMPCNQIENQISMWRQLVESKTKSSTRKWMYQIRYIEKYTIRVDIEMEN